MPYWAEVRLDGRVLVFAVLLTALAAMVAALFPAWKSTRGDIAVTLFDQSRGSTGLRVGRLMRGLVVLEVAFSFALLVATGLLVRGVRQVQNVPLGFASPDVYTARISLPDSYDAAARRRYYDELSRSLTALPQAQSVTLAGSLPATRAPWQRLAIDGVTYESEDDQPFARRSEVSNDFFATFGVPLLRGRPFGPADGPDAQQVAIVNQQFVQDFLPGGEPLGRRIRLGRAQDNAQWLTIVGVVPDVWMGGLDASGDRNPAGVYLPLAQRTPGDVSIALRVRAGPPLEIANAVREAAFRLDPDVPLYEVKDMPTVVVDNSWFYGFGAGLMAACGLSALLLATIGLYGVIAFSVSRRAREFGIRMAVGASPVQVIGLVLRRTGSLGLGLVIGAVLAYLLATGVSSLLFEVSPSDPVVFVGVALMLGTIGITASLVPALRAARTDVLTALRVE